jgi:hypothetical protein
MVSQEAARTEDVTKEEAAVAAEMARDRTHWDGAAQPRAYKLVKEHHCHNPSGLTIGLARAPRRQ